MKIPSLALLTALILSVVACHHGHKHHHHDGPLGHRFTDPQKWSERWDDPSRDAWQKPDEVIAKMAIEPGMALVDLGAGTGYFVPHLAKATGAEGSVQALDVEQPMVDWLTKRIAEAQFPNTTARLVPFDDPKLEPASVDRILIVNTWHHIGERPAYTAKLKAALKPGGTVVIVDYTLDAKPGPPKHARLSPESVMGDLKAGGLTPQLVDETLPRQYIVVGRN